MQTMPKDALRFKALIAISMLFTVALNAATTTWTAGSGTDTNWSTVANWSDGVPAAGSDVKFFDAGSVANPGTATSFVDAGFGNDVASLQLGNTNGTHTISIRPDGVLSLKGSLIIGTPGDVAAARNLTNSIQGANATLCLSNDAAILALNQGTATSVTGTRANLDLSALAEFKASLSKIGIGTTALQNPGSANQREAGLLKLARTNLIVLSYTDTLANYQTAGKANAIEMSRNPGNHAGIMSYLLLGETNAIYVDSLGIGRDKASTAAAAWMGFNPAFTNLSPVAYFRGAAGDDSRVTWWAVGDMNANASSAQHSAGIVDFRGGKIDALLNVLSLGRDCSSSHSATGSGRINTGTLVFDSGVIDANTILVGNQVLGPATSVTPNQGYVTVGAAATLRVNNILVLGCTVQNGGAAASTMGRLHVIGGLVAANLVSVGAVSTNNSIAVDSGTLAVSNTLGSASRTVRDLNLTNATLVFHVNGTLCTGFATNLTIGGTANIISLGTVAVFGSYPAQVPLLSYSILGGAGFNFALGSVPASAPGAYLSNNIANKSIDLVLPIDPRPAITMSPASYGGSPGDTVTFQAAYTGMEPVSILWLKDETVILADGPTASGSTIAGSTTSSLVINNAQAGDSGAYAIVVSNQFGSVTNIPPTTLLISDGDIAPFVTGPSNLTAVQGEDATFTAIVSGKPVPVLQWYKNGELLDGKTAASLTLSKVQYPDDQGLYALVAENVAGRVTNSASLTVIVPPIIAVQPASVTVTNTQAASFTVVSTNGVPAVSYQWKKNGNNIQDATGSAFSITSASPADMGSYTVLIQNSAGFVLSDPVTLTVNSTMSVASVSPASGAGDICFDSPLRITFSSAPVLRKAGNIRIFNVTNSVTPADTLDMALNADNHAVYAANVQPRLIGGESFVSFPVIIQGNTAVIYPHAGVLTSNQTYYVSIEPGVFTDTSGAYFTGISDPSAWQFSTKAALAATALTNPVVAADGSGDFATVQGALDYLPPSSDTRRLIEIRDGIFTEIINIKKHNVTLRGQSRAGTILTYPNNANLQGSTHFRMSFKVDAEDVAIESLTVTNSTPKGGGQAEALMVESGRRRFIGYNVNICSFQDTILLNTEGTQCYFENSVVQGDTDFIWGAGNAFFTNCEIKQLNASTALNPTGSITNGMAFIRCAFTRSPGLTGASMGRTRGIPNGNAAIINCRIDDHITAWSSDALPVTSYRLWDYGNSNITATASKVIGNCIALADGDPRIALAMDSTEWLYGWVPQLAPNITRQPFRDGVLPVKKINLSVEATGLPTPTFQWLRNGNVISGATNSVLSIEEATANDSGDYQVRVANEAGEALSVPVAITVANTVPLLNSIEDVTVNAGVALSIPATAVDPDVPAQTLSYQLLFGPANATIDQVSGVFSFRPQVAQAGSSNWCVVEVSDSAEPPGAATEGFAIMVNSFAQPQMGVAGFVGGAPLLNVSGAFGPDYQIEASTNLVDWQTVFNTNSPALPFQWSDPQAASFDKRFYRTQVGP